MTSFLKKLFGGATSPGHAVELPDESAASTVYEVAESIAFRADRAPLSRDVIRRFGGKGFLFNLRMWEARTRGTTASCYVPADDHYRGRFETLARTGVALRGEAVSLEMRVQALPMDAIRAAAKDLGVGTFRDKKSGARLVAAHHGISTWFADRYALDGFFLLVAERWSYPELEAQWRAYEDEARDTLAQREGEE